MFIIKNNYYLYIENIKDFDVASIKSNKKINIILRNVKNSNISEIINYRRKCKNKKIKFYISNNLQIAKKCNADGLYISAYNKKKYYANIPQIGSAHNIREINEKKKQGCKIVIISRLFKTLYKNKESCLGVLKFNLLAANKNIKIIALGGINNQNLLKLNNVRCDGLAILSEVKKKPVITNRLF